MIVGFTGTRNGMWPAQGDRLRELLQLIGAKALHHGDCVGADAAAHEIAKRLGLELHGHPSTHRLRAHCTGWTTVAPPLPPMERNAVIVASSQILIAAPDGPEQQRSGTWATVRMARQAGKTWYVIDPKGLITSGHGHNALNIER
jgi:hypothetical protein